MRMAVSTSMSYRSVAAAHDAFGPVLEARNEATPITTSPGFVVTVIDRFPVFVGADAVCPVGAPPVRVQTPIPQNDAVPLIVTTIVAVVPVGTTADHCSANCADAQVPASRDADTPP